MSKSRLKVRRPGNNGEHITKSRRTNDCNVRRTYCLGLRKTGSEGRAYFNIYSDSELGLDGELSRCVPDLVS